MRVPFVIALAFFALTLIGAPAVAQEFEGIIRMRDITFQADSLLDQGESRETLFDMPIEEILAFGESDRAAAAQFTKRQVVFEVSGSRVRVESPDGAMGAPGTYVTIDVEVGLYRIVIPGNGAYVEWTLDEMLARKPDLQLSSQATGGGSTQPLGRQVQIDRYQTEGFRLEVGDRVRIVWATAELDELAASFRHVVNHLRMVDFSRLTDEDDPNEVGMLAQMERLFAEHGFPLRTRTLEPDGRFRVQDVLAIDPESLDSALFDAPADLMKLSLDQVLQGG